jgi:hypothetical protein
MLLTRPYYTHRARAGISIENNLQKIELRTRLLQVNIHVEDKRLRIPITLITTSDELELILQIYGPPTDRSSWKNTK